MKGDGLCAKTAARAVFAVSGFLILALSSCAATSVHTEGSMPRCVRGERQSALVYWGTDWRTDQKDVEQREEAALRGIEDFFLQSTCYAARHIERIASENALHQNGVVSAPPGTDRIIVITVRELGPVVRLCASPALVDGGTEAVIAVRVLAAEGGLLAECKIHWQNGGPFVIKNTRTLRNDMHAALRAALEPE